MLQITLTKTYNQASLLEDIRIYTETPAPARATVLFTGEIKAESFLET